MRKLLKIIIPAIIVAVLICGIAIKVDYIFKLKSNLDFLHSLVKNEHSAMAGVAMDFVRENLRRELIHLTLLVIMVFVTVIASWLINNGYAKRKGFPRLFCVGLCFANLTSLLLMPIPNLESSVDYCRIQMKVPKESWLQCVAGKIQPYPIEIFGASVNYHIGLVSPTTPPEWIGGGFVTYYGQETIFYIETLIDGDYAKYTNTTSTVSFYQSYFIFAVNETYWHKGLGWGMCIYDYEFQDPRPSKLMLEKANIDFPSNWYQKFVGVAGGESQYKANPMRAEFSRLTWESVNEELSGDDWHQSGYWDGDKFECDVIEDNPYKMDIDIPYYDFNVYGGDPPLYPIWDIDQNGDCNILDLSAVGRALGTDDTWPWGTGWDEYNPDCDMNGDHQIGLDDLMIVANNYADEY